MCPLYAARLWHGPYVGVHMEVHCGELRRGEDASRKQARKLPSWHATDKVVFTQKLERSIPLSLLLDQRFFIGIGGPSPVDDRDYQGPFKFTGKINKRTIALDPPKLTPEDVKKLEEANRAAQDAK
jgi:hypothetical protein